MSALGNVPLILEGPDPLGLVGAVVDVDAKGVEPSRIDAYEQGGAPLLVGVAPALAEDTVGVGPADEAETASAAKPKALVSWAQDKVRRGREVDAQPHEALPQKGERNVEALSREGEREADEPQPEALPQKGERNPEVLSCKRKVERPEAPPPDGERERGTMPQGTPNEGTCKPSSPSRQPSHDVVLSTWEGPGPWDPGGGPASERTVDSKRPVEAMNVAAGIVAHKKTLAVQKWSQSASTVPRSQPRTFIPFSIRCLGLLSSRSPFIIHFSF